MTYSGAEQSGTSYRPTVKTLHKISWER